MAKYADVEAAKKKILAEKAKDPKAFAEKYKTAPDKEKKPSKKKK